MSQPSLCFIIACKVYRSYESYIPLYVSNIKEYYPEALILLVDNNSSYTEFYNQFSSMKNVLVLENTSEGKFELGAYKFATEYIKSNNLKFDYYLCSQDTFVLVNKYDFNRLVKDNVKACPIGHFYFHRSFGKHVNVLRQLGLYDPSEEFSCCWCVSWCCDHESLLNINILLASIVPRSRGDSEETERYMGKILKMLNNSMEYAIELGVEGNADYDCHTIDPRSEAAKNTGHFFIKRAQQKHEYTV